MAHEDIRIGTLAPLNGQLVSYLQQILPHGFESFCLNVWQYLPELDLSELAKQVRQVIADQAIISCLGVYGNPLQDPRTAADIARAIDACALFGCDLVSGFAGALDGRPLPESLEAFEKTWAPLVQRAADRGVRLAWENCDMGGWWHDVRWNIAHAPSAWEMLFERFPQGHVGLQWEPCHQMTSLIDPLPQLRQWAGKVFHVHGKDGTLAWDIIRRWGIRGGKQYHWHRTPGFGDTNWTDVISILRMQGFRGSIDIEGWHDPVYQGELEMTGQVHALNYLKQCRGGEFVPNPRP